MTTKWSDLLKEAGSTGSYEPLPTGTYEVKITKSAHKVAQSGKSMFEVEMQVLSGPHANRRLWNRFVVTPDSPKALGYFFSNMRVLGLDATFFSAQPTDDQVANALMNKQCRVEVGQSEYNGSIRNDVKKVLPSEGGVTAAPLAPTSPAMSTPPAAPVVPTTPVAPVVPVATAPSSLADTVDEVEQTPLTAPIQISPLAPPPAPF